MGSREDPERSESVIETGHQYLPGDPVLVRVVHRAHRIEVTDDGAAIARAGRPPRWRDAATRIQSDLVVNVSRRGVVSLPVVRAGPPEAEIVERIAEASLALYEELLEISVVA